MAPDSFDLVVVGGGPAGAAAAYSAARAGLRVCLVDKADFPRDKLCAGGLTERCRTIFDAVFETPWPDALAGQSDRLRFRMTGAPMARTEGYTRLGFTQRHAFDAHLVERARAAGVEMALADPADALDPAARTLRLRSGRTLGWTCLVGADGVNSFVARSLYGRAFDPDQIGFALEVQVPRADLPGQDEEVEIDFGAATWGYGWIFPKPDAFTIGVAGVHRRNPELKTALRAYLSSLGLDPDRYRMKGQFIPFGHCRRAPGEGRVLLCGDAAGFVDPITGEGIAYALQSGAAAGRAVVAALAAGRPDAALADYRRAVAPIIRAIGQARGWRRLIFPAWARPLFAKAFRRAHVMRLGYLDIMAGAREYDALPALALRQAGAAARRLVRR